MILSTDPKIKRPTIYISELAEEIKPALRPLRITRLSCVSIHQEKYIFRNSHLPQKKSFCQTSKRCHFLRVQLSPGSTLGSTKGYSRSFLLTLTLKTFTFENCKSARSLLIGVAFPPAAPLAQLHHFCWEILFNHSLNVCFAYLRFVSLVPDCSPQNGSTFEIIKDVILHPSPHIFLD